MSASFPSESAIKVLIVDDSEDDTLLLVRDLIQAGYKPTFERVDTPEQMDSSLRERVWDIVVSDHRMPRFDALGALELLKGTGIDVPFIVLSGTIGEEVAVEAMRAGARDYILKDHTARLVPAIQRELREADLRKRAAADLQRWQRDWEDIFQSIGNPALILDRSHRIQAVNRAFLRTIHVEPDDLIGATFCQMVHGQTDCHSGCPVMRSSKTKRHEADELDLSALGGTYLVSCTPLLGETGEVDRLIVIASDLTSRKQAEADLRETVTRLRLVLDGTIQAIAATVEVRDPYTAGHQRRVARLAHGIVGELGLGEEQTELIRFAASVHDLGKIGIPAEILTKPGALSPVELLLIQQHPKIGYDILKNVEFPWPIAEVVYQHHERLNGSGYPRGLRGDDISFEARILAVADVVEAMASHRPYRPARGLDEALAEITQKADTLYDSRVVDACGHLFADRGFALE